MDRLASQLAQTSSRLWETERKLDSVQRHFAVEMDEVLSRHKKELAARQHVDARSAEEQVAKRVEEVEAKWRRRMIDEANAARSREDELLGQLNDERTRREGTERRLNLAEAQMTRADARAAQMAAAAHRESLSRERIRPPSRLNQGVHKDIVSTTSVLHSEVELSRPSFRDEVARGIVEETRRGENAMDKAADTRRVHKSTQSDDTVLADEEAKALIKAEENARALASARAELEKARATAQRAVEAADRADARAAHLQTSVHERMEAAAPEVARAAVAALQRALETAAASAARRDDGRERAPPCVSDMLRSVAAALPSTIISSNDAPRTAIDHIRVEEALVAQIERLSRPHAMVIGDDALQAARREGVAEGRAEARAAMSADVEKAVKARLAAAVEAELAAQLGEDTQEVAEAGMLTSTGRHVSAEPSHGASIQAVHATIGAMQRQLRAARLAFKTGDVGAVQRLQRELPEVSRSILMAVQAHVERGEASADVPPSTPCVTNHIPPSATVPRTLGNDQDNDLGAHGRRERRRLEGLINAAQRTSREQDERIDALNALSEGLRMKADIVEKRLAAVEEEKALLVKRNSELQSQLDTSRSTQRHRFPMVAASPPPPPPPPGWDEPSECLISRPQCHDESMASQCTIAMDWIAKVIGTPIPDNQENLHGWLKSGVMLCDLINQIQPGIVVRISHSPAPFKQMENIGNYINACTLLGVAPHDLFTPTDLFEKKNMAAVVRNVYALSRVAQKIGFKGPKLMPQNSKISSRLPTMIVS